MDTRWNVYIWVNEEWEQYSADRESLTLADAIDVVNHLVNFGVEATIKRKET